MHCWIAVGKYYSTVLVQSIETLQSLSKHLMEWVINKLRIIERLKNLSSSMNDWLDFPVRYTNKYLPLDKNDRRTLSKLRQLNHLKSIIDQISMKESRSVSLLIGANCTLLTLLLVNTMGLRYLTQN